MSERVTLVVEYEVEAGAHSDGVLGPLVDKLRADGYLGQQTGSSGDTTSWEPGVRGAPGVRVVSLHGAIRESAARVMATFELDEES